MFISFVFASRFAASDVLFPSSCAAQATFGRSNIDGPFGKIVARLEGEKNSASRRKGRGPLPSSVGRRRKKEDDARKKTGLKTMVQQFPPRPPLRFFFPSSLFFSSEPHRGKKTISAEAFVAQQLSSSLSTAPTQKAHM